MTQEKTAVLKITRETRDRLDALKRGGHDTYDDVIQRLLSGEITPADVERLDLYDRQVPVTHTGRLSSK